LQLEQVVLQIGKTLPIADCRLPIVGCRLSVYLWSLLSWKGFFNQQSAIGNQQSHQTSTSHAS